MMKFTEIKCGSKGRTYRGVAEEDFVKMVRSEQMGKLVELHRKDYLLKRARGEALDDSRAFYSNWVADVCFAGEWKKVKRKLEMKSYNGLVLLEINNLRSTEDAVNIRKEAARIPYTRMAFVGLSAFSVKIVCGISCEEGFENLTREQIERYHLNAYKRLHYIYSSHLGLSVDNVEPKLDLVCMCSYDKDMYYNPNAEKIFARNEDVDIPEYKGDAKVRGALDFGQNGAVAMGTIYEWCLRDATEKARTLGHDGDELDEAVLSLLAGYCHESNLPLDYAIMHTTWKWRFDKFDLNYITLVFTNAYEEDEARMIPYGHVNNQALMAYKVEAFLKTHYELRRNVMTGVVQFRQKNGFNYDFRNLTESAMNSMTNEAIKQGIGSWDKDMRRIVNSDMVPSYDPVTSYLYNLPSWDGKDRVEELVARIPSDCQDLKFYIHTWLLSMVAHWLGKDSLHGNALVPILIGGQGCGKTSFCSVILPPELRDYYNDKVEFKNETSLVLGLSSFALINVDEFDALKKSQQPTLKYLLSKSDVKLRLPFGKSFEHRRRYASFIATTNNPRPLVDRTGSRRFACVKILPGKRIDFITPIEYEQLYAQLLDEVSHGKQYWLDEQQTTRLMQHNTQFMQVATLQQVLDSLFCIPQNEEETEKLTSYEVVDIIEKAFPEWNITKGIANEIGKYFNSRGFECGKTNKSAYYRVKRI